MYVVDGTGVRIDRPLGWKRGGEGGPDVESPSPVSYAGNLYGARGMCELNFVQPCKHH